VENVSVALFIDVDGRVESSGSVVCSPFLPRHLVGSCVMPICRRMCQIILRFLHEAKKDEQLPIVSKG
jgi:hypothetical protein